MSLMPFFILWGVLALGVLTLAMMRKSISSKEDDTIHLSSATAVSINDQVAISKRLDVIDKWGKLLTIILVVTFVILASIYGYQLWVESSTAGVK
jgi:hypothetical protein